MVELAIEIFEEIVGAGRRWFLPAARRDVGFDVAGERGELVVRGDLVFGAFAVAQDGLRGFLIVPEIGIGDAGFERSSGARDEAAASKIAPNHGDAGLQEFVAVLEIFENHEMGATTWSARSESRSGFQSCSLPPLTAEFRARLDGGGEMPTGIRSSSRDVFPFRKVKDNRITETRTQSQANQSPARV